jgi:DNA repair protein RecN (Recombination protein N)
MLTQLNVRDFAIIESAEIAFGAGMTVVTGETGAGKSLLVDALLLLTGARADSAAVRTGCERAELSAAFDLSRLPQARSWLVEHELDDDPDECQLRRVVRSEGASKAWINGRPVPMQTLAGFAALLIEIHGQHEHQALLDRGAQLTLLDAHGNHADLLQEVDRLASHWHALERQRRVLASGTGDEGERIALLGHHLRELQREALDPAALATLEQEHRRLAHQDEVVEACGLARALLDGESGDAALTAITQARAQLERASQRDGSLTEVAALVSGIGIELTEAIRQIDAYLGDADPDPERFRQIDAQLSRLHDLSRKHRVPVAELAQRRDRIADELAKLENAGRDLELLTEKQAHALDQWQEAATRLSHARKATAQQLARDASHLMDELGMAGGRFEVSLEPTASDLPDRLGRERIEFMVGANAGQPMRPLRKVASGGELSRIALAIEVAALGDDPVPTMIFDEVDAGIGGAVAEILGRKLRHLAGHAQVLCVTHLAQVAAQAHSHVLVRKDAHAGQTRTAVTALTGEARVQEIARMLGGVEITPTTLAHARQFLASATQA